MQETELQDLDLDLRPHTNTGIDSPDVAIGNFLYSALNCQSKGKTSDSGKVCVLKGLEKH